MDWAGLGKFALPLHSFDANGHRADHYGPTSLASLSPLTVSPVRVSVPSNQPSAEHRQTSFASLLFSIVEDFAITTTYAAHGPLVTDPYKSLSFDTVNGE